MEANKVALCLRQPIPRMVKLSKDKSYFFDVKHSVCLAWIDEEDVATMLNVKGGCCGGQKPLCHRASEGEIRVWTTGKR